MDIDIKQQGGDASEVTLGEIRDLLQKQVDFAESVWIDATDTYCIRRVSYSEDLLTYTISYTLPDGSAYSPTLPLEPASAGADREVVTETYTVITSGTGYSIGDIVQQARIYDTNLGTVLSTIWFNETTNLAISPAPTISHLLPEGSAQTTAANTTAISSATGTTADAAYTTGSGTIVSILKGIFTRLGFSQNAGATDATTLRTTQSSDSPLVTSTGGVADVAYVSGSGSVIAILKGIFGRLTLGQATMASSIPVAIASDQSAVPVSQSGTWNINNVSGTVSLPTGASTEATLAANGVLLGAVNETAPGTDTASSGLNGRLQRIAQRLTSLIALWITPGTAIGTSAVSPTGVSDGTNFVRLRSDSNGRLELAPSTVAPTSTQTASILTVAAAVTQNQNSAGSVTVAASGGRSLQVTNNSGVVCDITVGGTSGGADGTTIATAIAGDSFTIPFMVAASAVIRIKPTSAALTATDYVKVQVT